MESGFTVIRSFENLFGDSNNEKMERRSYDCSPSTNILEKNDSFELQIALPGVKKQDVKIDLEKNILSISSEKRLMKSQPTEPNIRAGNLFTAPLPVIHFARNH